MVLKKITKDMLLPGSRSGIATISFYRRGLVMLSKVAVNKIGAVEGIDIYQGDKPSEFYISAGDSFRLRKNGGGGMVFSSKGLCEMVIKKNWDIMPHSTMGEEAPSYMKFTVCNLPIDDAENKHVFALLRKKV